MESLATDINSDTFRYLSLLRIGPNFCVLKQIFLFIWIVIMWYIGVWVGTHFCCKRLMKRGMHSLLICQLNISGFLYPLRDWRFSFNTSFISFAVLSEIYPGFSLSPAFGAVWTVVLLGIQSNHNFVRILEFYSG